MASQLLAWCCHPSRNHFIKLSHKHFLPKFLDFRGALFKPSRIIRFRFVFVFFLIQVSCSASKSFWFSKMAVGFRSLYNFFQHFRVRTKNYWSQLLNDKLCQSKCMPSAGITKLTFSKYMHSDSTQEILIWQTVFGLNHPYVLKHRRLYQSTQSWESPV